MTEFGADLEAVDLRKAFGGTVALDGASFSADRGEVHALLGENGAGKSTFIKILMGAVRPDAGEIRLFGDSVTIRSPREAEEMGIRAVFQEFALIPDLTVAQNVWLRREPRNLWLFASARKMRKATRRVLEELDLTHIDPDAEVAGLSVADRQLVEIVRNLSTEPRILILDEATSALSPREADLLLALARRLARTGVIVLFISHRLQEVRRVADHVTIFRNGRNVGSHPIAEITDDEIISEMLGRRASRLYPPKESHAVPEVALSVSSLRSGHRLQGVTFELRKGEVLGVGGVQGQGQGELLLALYGVLPSSGRIEINGKRYRIRNPRQALRAGIGLTLVPEDRKNQGLLLPKPVRENVSLPILGQLTHWGIIDRSSERKMVQAVTEQLRLVAHDLEQPVGTLSGGNQQKVVIAKALLAKVRILLLYDLVRGVDVGTKAEIFQLMRDLAADGYSILFYSTDLQELINVCDRVIVMSHGWVNAELEGSEITEENIVQASFGVKSA